MSSIAASLAESIQIHVLTYDELSDALSGSWSKSNGVKKPWLGCSSDELYRPKYYTLGYRGDFFSGKKYERTFYVASVPWAVDSNESPDVWLPEGDLKLMAGVLETQVSVYDNSVMWMKYVAVAKVYQRQGIARSLILKMIGDLKGSRYLLERSRASDEGEIKIQATMDTLLDAHGIPWIQGDRKGPLQRNASVPAECFM